MNKSPSYYLHKLVLTLDKRADQLLQAEFGISHRRALFLAALHDGGSMTQHALAVELGYSDPSTSTMLAVLSKEGYVTIVPSKVHGRKRIVSLTQKGSELVVNAQKLLDAQFSEFSDSIDVDMNEYGKLTQQIYQSIIEKKEQ